MACKLVVVAIKVFTRTYNVEMCFGILVNELSILDASLQWNDFRRLAATEMYWRQY